MKNNAFIKSKIDAYNSLDSSKKLPSEVLKTYIKRSRELDEKIDSLSDILNSFEKGSGGLVSDEIRASSEFKKALYDFKVASNKAKEFAINNKKISDFYHKNFMYVLKKDIDLDLIEDSVENEESTAKKTRKMR